jgi:two-component system, NtrC family, nitrogen regulation response regulator GlnG
MSIKNILVADDEESMRWVLSKALRKKGFTVELARDGDEALRMVKENLYDLALLDIKMPGITGLELLDRIKEERGELFVIIMTAEASMKNAVEAMKRGAYDYLTKPFDLSVIDAVVEKVSRAREMTSQVSLLKEELKDRYQLEKTIIGNSPAMRDIYKTIGKVAPSDVTVLVQGESGTGKELIARAIHYNSKRLGKPFIPLNCAAIPKELLESELFGFEKGAFTGASERKLGKFEQANGGTIFLDEIGDMPFDLQAKILRVLQEREITRTGGNQSIPVDVRIVAATNQDLEESVRNKQFREDLYYRLNVLDIEIPPLRERRGDLPLLLQYFLNKFTQPGKPPSTISPRAWAVLSQYHFPGNVREFAHAIEHAVVLAGGGEIEVEHLPGGITGALDGAVSTPAGSLRSLSAALKEFEHEYLMRALAQSNGKKMKAAEILGISRKNLWEKLRLHGIASEADTEE